MKIKNYKLLIIFLGTPSIIFSQINETNNYALTGNLKSDSKLVLENNLTVQVPNIVLDNSNKKKPMLAGLFSLIFPGAGEFYSESYLKAGIFAALEAIVVTTAIVYNKKGDDQTTSFENFANQNWDVKRYAQWTINNINNINPSVDPNNFNVFKNDGSVDFSELNKLEGALGSGYSHILPPFGDQQYYELIGKYPQYSHGWNDANQSDTDFHIISPNFLFYSGERGKANDYYNISDKAIIGIYINHLLSAIDAIWSTNNYNENLVVKMKVENLQFAGKNELVPTIDLKIHF